MRTAVKRNDSHPCRFFSTKRSAGTVIRPAAPACARGAKRLRRLRCSSAKTVTRYPCGSALRRGMRVSKRRTSSAVIRTWTSGLSSLKRARKRSSSRNSSSDSSGGPVSMGSAGDSLSVTAPRTQSVGRSRTTIVPAAIQRLEQREITPHAGEHEQHHHGGEPALQHPLPRQHTADDHASAHPEHHHAEEQEQQVHQPGRHAGADTSELEVDLDVLRRLDAVMLAQIEVSRGSRHVLILPPVPSRSDPLARISGPCSSAKSSTAASTSTAVTSACSCA